MRKYFAFALTMLLLMGFIPQACTTTPEPEPIPVETLEQGLWVGTISSEENFEVDLQFTVVENTGTEISGTTNFTDEPVETTGTMRGHYEAPNWIVILTASSDSEILTIELIGTVEEYSYTGTTKILNTDATFEFEKRELE